MPIKPPRRAAVESPSLIPVVTYIDPAGRLRSLYPEVTDTIAQTEPVVARAVRDAQKLGTDVAVSWMRVADAVAVTRVRVVR
jgi:hypothetical protein